MAETYSIYLIIYELGLAYTIIGGVVVSFTFALWRWIKCVRDYIQHGTIDDAEGSFFFGRNNWFYGPSTMDYYNNPWAVAVDIVTISIGIGLLAFVWPISVIVIFTIIYAKITRVRYVRKKEFVDRLAGEHV